MGSAQDLLFYVATGALTLYTVLQVRSRPLGATTIFLALLLVHHGPALLFYRDTWSETLGFGLLSDLDNTGTLASKVVSAMSLCFIALLAGLVYSDYLLFRQPRLVPQNDLATLQPLPSYVHRRLLRAASALVLFVLLVLAAQYLFVAGPSAIYDYYAGDISDFERFRIRREANISFYPYGVLIGTIIPFVSFVLLAERMARPLPKLTHALVLIVATILLAKFSQYTKAGPVLFLMQLLFCYLIAKKGSLRVSRHELLFVGMSLVAIFAMVMSVGEGVDLVVVFDRLLMVPNEGIFEYFAAIPDSYPFGYGRGISIVSFLFGDAIGSPEPLPVYTHVAAVTRGEYGTNVNSFFIADAWAEFGWVGIVVLSFVVGILVKWYDNYSARFHYRSVRVALVVLALSGCYALATSAVTTSLVTGGLLICPLFASWLCRPVPRASRVLPERPA